MIDILIRLLKVIKISLGIALIIPCVCLLPIFYVLFGEDGKDLIINIPAWLILK